MSTPAIYRLFSDTPSPSHLCHSNTKTTSPQWTCDLLVLPWSLLCTKWLFTFRLSNEWQWLIPTPIVDDDGVFSSDQQISLIPWWRDNPVSDKIWNIKEWSFANYNFCETKPDFHMAGLVRKINHISISDLSCFKLNFCLVQEQKNWFRKK